MLLTIFLQCSLVPSSESTSTDTKTEPVAGCLFLFYHKINTLFQNVKELLTFHFPVAFFATTTFHFLPLIHSPHTIVLCNKLTVSFLIHYIYLNLLVSCWHFSGSSIFYRTEHFHALQRFSLLLTSQIFESYS